MFQPGQKVARLTILRKIEGTAQHIVKCECGAPAFAVWDATLRRGERRGCDRREDVERKYAKEIRAAKKAAAQMGRRFEPLPVKPSWEFEGDDDALVAMNDEKEQKHAQEN